MHTENVPEMLGRWIYKAQSVYLNCFAIYFNTFQNKRMGNMLIIKKITYFLTAFTLILGMASMVMCALDGVGVTHLGIRAFLGL